MTKHKTIVIGNRKIQSTTWIEFRRSVGIKYDGKTWGKMDYEIDRALQFHAERMKRERGEKLPGEKRIETPIFGEDS